MKFYKLTLSFFAVFCFLNSFSQVNLNLLSTMDYQQMRNTKLNDVWGYVDETGKEYVLLGAEKGTAVIDISNPSQPVEIFWEPGLHSTWRDLKTWGDYAYITTEALNGLLILDLTSLPDPSGITSSYYNNFESSSWKSAHNLFIDSNGYAYIFGANGGMRGVIILDVHTDPLNPIEVGVFDEWYCHDGYVLRDTMYLAHINDGFMSIVDVTNKANPILLGTKNTHSNFTHNVWTTDDGKFAFTTDEVSGAYLGAYDVSDPSNIIEVDLIQSSPGKGVIPHNVHVKGDFLITSYYSDGVTIHDISRPHNMIQVGDYDTYPLQTTSYDGCWGAFPFFPSGIIAASDITEGLFILQPNYTYGSYLEGKTFDQSNGNQLEGVKVQIIGNEQFVISKLNGDYATGILGNGQYEVSFQKIGYYPKTISVNLLEGIVTNLDVELSPIQQFPLTIIVKETGTNQPILGAKIRLEGEMEELELSTNGFGEANFALYYEEDYFITAGKWGYVTKCQDFTINSSTHTIEIFLDKGYYDDFSFDFGWTTSAEFSNTSGRWERVIPNPNLSEANPHKDAQFDCGKYAFVTGNSGNFDYVNNGRVTLFSPIFDLTFYETPHIHYERWFYCYHGYEPFNDTLQIFLSNGITTVLIDKQTYDFESFFKWNQRSIKVSDYIEATSTMQLIITTADYPETENVTEAGFDHFFVSNLNHLIIDEKDQQNEVFLYPNPTNGIVRIVQNPVSTNWKLIGVDGKVLGEFQSSEAEFTIDISSFSNGLYILSSQQKFLRILKQ
jgi:choice-of-anchor B domain-containing protein